MQITISPNGELSFIYKDELRPLLDIGKADIRRVSHVEPTQDGRWSADLSPVGGPILGPFEFRQDALEAEVEWLNQHVLGGTDEGRRSDGSGTTS